MNDPFDKMDEAQASRVAYLIAGYIRQTLTEKEHDELDEWMTANDDNQRLFEELTDPDTIQRGLNKMKEIDVDAARERVKGMIKFSDGAIIKKRRRWLAYSIAASVIIVAGVVLFFMTNKKTGTKKPIAAKTETIQAGGNYATLTLSDGKTVNLFDAKNGLIDSMNGNEVLKTADGQISYESNLHLSDVFHVLSTPVGGQYQVVLPDGTRVWLNSSSSLKYPVAFDEKERVVELRGEGYFEVASSPGLSTAPSGGGHVPFIVKVGEVRVEVLGTHFNVNGYEEGEVKTVLVEGKVIVSREKSNVRREMKPGDEIRVTTDGTVKLLENADTSVAVAWKNGEFKFVDATIDEIMRHVARWYDAEVVYEKKNDHHFNATIKRTEPIQKLLNVLEETNEVKFRVEGKKIYVGV